MGPYVIKELRLKKLIEVLSQHSYKEKFLRCKDMKIFDFLCRHLSHVLVSLNKIIQIAFQMKDLLNNADK